MLTSIYSVKIQVRLPMGSNDKLPQIFYRGFNGVLLHKFRVQIFGKNKGEE
jgi:hypothetical protein